MIEEGGYLRVRNFWDYQNADAWKKARANKRGNRHPAWCKLYAARDYEIDQLPVVTRLVWYELLRLATIHANAIPNDSQLILKQISIDSQDYANACGQLIKGGWIKVSKTKRLSREPSRNFLPLDRDRDRENPLPPFQGKSQPPKIPSSRPPRPTAKAVDGQATCPHCGISTKGPRSLAEHIENVHYDEAA